MAKRWVLDTDTKGTGARMVPLEDVLEKPKPAAPAHPRKPPAPGSPRPKTGAKKRPKAGGETRLTQLPPGHVRKKSTGEIGRVQSVDPKAGTATVMWLKQGRASTIPISSITRK